MPKRHGLRPVVAALADVKGHAHFGPPRARSLAFTPTSDRFSRSWMFAWVLTSRRVVASALTEWYPVLAGCAGQG